METSSNYWEGKFGHIIFFKTTSSRCSVVSHYLYKLSVTLSSISFVVKVYVRTENVCSSVAGVLVKLLKLIVDVKLEDS